MSRVFDRLSKLLGYTMLLIGFAGPPLGVRLVYVALVKVARGLPDASSGLGFSLILLSPLIIVPGWYLASGRKNLVLFLRRFGNKALNDAIRDLLQGQLRRRYRLVTLDDSSFVPAGAHWRGIVTSLAPAALILIYLGLTLPMTRQVTEQHVMHETPLADFEALLLIAEESLLWLSLFAAVVLAVLALRAHRTAHGSIRDEPSRARSLRRVRSLRSFRRAPSIAAPLATVLSVSDAEWQSTVADIAKISEIIFLDVSVPSESILWELRTIRQTAARVILLGSRAALDSYWDGDLARIADPLARAIRELAGETQLIRYESPERIDVRALLAVLR